VRQAYIKQSVILNYQVCCNKTSGGCYIHAHCPRLPANVTATLSPPIGRMDSAICKERGGVCVGGGGMGRHACGHVSLQSPLTISLISLSPITPPPPRWRLTGACQEPVNGRTDGQAGDPVQCGAC